MKSGGRTTCRKRDLHRRRYGRPPPRPLVCSPSAEIVRAANRQARRVMGAGRSHSWASGRVGSARSGGSSCHNGSLWRAGLPTVGTCGRFWRMELDGLVMAGRVGWETRRTRSVFSGGFRLPRADLRHSTEWNYSIVSRFGSIVLLSTAGSCHIESGDVFDISAKNIMGSVAPGYLGTYS